jgi:hypothetical protein
MDPRKQVASETRGLSAPKQQSTRVAVVVYEKTKLPTVRAYFIGA